MSIKYNCYFCEQERDMGASWMVCTYNQEKDKDYWRKKPPCEDSDNDCPFYLSEEQAYNIIRKEVEKNVD
jgi:hypothetical protein